MSERRRMRVKTTTAKRLTPKTVDVLPLDPRDPDVRRAKRMRP
jgi:hypothetical protein